MRVRPVDDRALVAHVDDAHAELRQTVPDRLDGAALPDFEMIRRYFGPAGIGMQTLPDGWAISGVSLPRTQQEPEVARRPVSPAK